MIQDYLEEVASKLSSESILTELTELWATDAGASAGSQWTREELHDRSGVR
jgi:hypothetical protein